MVKEVQPCFACRRVKISRYTRRDHLIEVKYNKISQLGILNGDRVRLIEVKFIVNRLGPIFGNLKSVRFIEGDRL